MLPPDILIDLCIHVNALPVFGSVVFTEGFDMFELLLRKLTLSIIEINVFHSALSTHHRSIYPLPYPTPSPT